MASTPVATPAPTTEQKILSAIAAASQLAADIAATFGHATIGGAIAEFSSLAPVFAGIFDAVKGLVSHGKAAQ